MDTNAAFLDPGARRRLFPAFLMMLSVTFGFWGVATFVPTMSARSPPRRVCRRPYYSAVAGLLGTGVAIVGFISLGFCADAIGRKPTAMIWYAMCLILTPVVYMWAQSIGALLVTVTVFGFFPAGSGPGPDLAARAVPDADARHCRRLLLQRAPLDLLRRSADRRHLDRQPRRRRSSAHSSSSVSPRRRSCRRRTENRSPTPCCRQRLWQSGRPSPADCQCPLPHLEAFQSLQETHSKQRDV